PAAPAAAKPASVPAAPAPTETGWHGQYFTVSDVGQVRADVKAWQAKMVAAGYPITVDGQYGPQSAAATTKFEKAHGLEVESPGIVGPQVWSALTK
ncbi:MAG TPA: peptidoglycan-binding domain-containing protein, partial [Acidothermaceae bacterium]|nr:peptidoglycan-binding domain-containing protein [Acidothermaceae bacterium]